MAKVGVILAGCGVFDGAEIHESVCLMLALAQAGVEYQCIAPSVPQMHVINHAKGEPAEGENRNVLTEAARLARGEIVALDTVNVADYDALAFPGGFGAAKNLCTFAVEGANCTVQPDVARVIRETHAAGKPLVFMCIAPVIAAKVLGDTGVKLTVGDDAGTAGAINAMGGTHVTCPVDDAYVDVENKVISTPAYMKASGVAEVFAGAKRSVEELLKLLG